MIIFDLEADGLLDAVTKIHCLAAYDTNLKKTFVYRTHETIAAFIKAAFTNEMDRPEVMCGHNIIGYDLPALQKVFPWFKPHKNVLDTLVLSRLIHSDLFEGDMKLSEAGKLPKRLTGSHSLEAWGYRLGEHKGDFSGPWGEWTQEMEDYCVQDVAVTKKLLAKIKHEEYSQEAVQLEHEVQWVIQRQIRHGVTFDVPAAQMLYADLMVKRDDLTRSLKETFGCWFEMDGKVPFVPKRDNANLGYLADVPFSKVKLVEFNPGSRQHIAKRLTAMFGWKPKAFTETGLAEINEKVLEALQHYPPVALLLEYLTVDKRIGQVAEGDNGWLKMIKDDGRIHGNVNTNGAVTGRMTHSTPNLAQVPSNTSPYGHECRALFTAAPGMVLVGADASSLEGRTMSHYTTRYDGGEYAKLILEGDVHWANTQALELIPRGTKRNKDEETEEGKFHDSIRGIAKTWFYAWLYGAGDKKLAVTLKCSEDKAKRLRAAFLKDAKALGQLQDDIAKAFKEKGFLKGIDGRILKVRSEHSALNTLLQSCGAILMKRALVILDNNLQKTGWVPGVDYEFLLNVHDEWQIEVAPHRADYLAETTVQAIRDAGKYYKLRVPLDGAARIGKNWAETH